MVKETCSTEPSTLLDQCAAFEIIGEQMKNPYIQEGCKRLIQEAIAGKIVSDGDCQEQTILTISEIADKVIEIFTKDV